MDWDLSSYFSDIDGADFHAAKSALSGMLNTLQMGAASLPTAMAATAPADWLDFLMDYEDLMARRSHLSSYVGCFCAARADSEAGQREEAALAELEIQFEKLNDILLRKVGAADEALLAAIAAQPGGEGLGHPLTLWRKEAAQRMDPELEGLAAELGLHGIGAWSRLYSTTMGNLKFQFRDPQSHEVKSVPMAHYVSLLASPDTATRRAVQAGAAETLSHNKHLYAAALNAIAGTRHTLNARRGVSDFLATSCHQSRIERVTLDALMSAITQRLPFARAVFAERCKAIGIDNPSFADLRAPLQTAAAAPDWNAACALIGRAFDSAYPQLATFFNRLIAERWVDHAPRDGKRPGGFCSTSLLARESRIFMTYRDTLGDVLTLAHETGHAWHSAILKHTRPLLARYPMPLAETASTFAERMLTLGVLNDPQADDATRLTLLDAEVEHMLAFLLDLPVRFKFESAFYAARQSGSVSPSAFCELMRATQRDVFGDALAVGGEDPWFWASKLHFYIDDVEFYNYPYTFGYLLSVAFSRRVQSEGPRALAQFERFLALSGSQSCENAVMMALGADIRTPAFWCDCIDALGETVALYRSLLPH